MTGHTLTERLLAHAHVVNEEVVDIDGALQAYHVAATGRRMSETELNAHKLQIDSGHLPAFLAQFFDEMPQ